MSNGTVPNSISASLKTDLTDFTPIHGVAIGNNKHQPETQLQLELVIKALRLFNVGAMNEAESVISNAQFSDEDKRWLKIELRAIVGFLG